MGWVLAVRGDHQAILAIRIFDLERPLLRSILTYVIPGRILVVTVGDV